MGDRTYARITIPAHSLATDSIRQSVAEVFCLSPQDMIAIMAENPLAEGAGPCNDCRLRLIRGVSCLVWEYDEANYGASAESEALLDLSIPFLLLHGPGDEYGAGRTASDGVQCWSVEVNHADQIVAEVDEINGVARINSSELDHINAFFRAEAAVFSQNFNTSGR